MRTVCAAAAAAAAAALDPILHTPRWDATGPPRELDQDELAFLRDVEAAEYEKERAEQLEVQRALSEFKVRGEGVGTHTRAQAWFHGGAAVVVTERAGRERGGQARGARDAGDADPGTV